MEKFIYCSYHEDKQVNNIHKGEIPVDTRLNTLDHRFWCEVSTIYEVFKKTPRFSRVYWSKNKYNLVGFTHYRRHFNADKIKNDDLYKIVVPNKFYCDKSIRDQFACCHNVKYLDMVTERLENPEFFETQKFLYPGNMFIMNRMCFDIYCSWLFDILIELSSKIEMTSNKYQNRMIGFIAERLFTYWIVNNKIPTTEVQVI